MQAKYILTLTNTRSFIQYEFFEDSIAETSQIQWYPLTYDVRFEQVRMITHTQLKLNDYHMSVGDLRKDESKGFEIDVTETRVLPYNNRFQNAITFEMSMNRNEFTRTVYNIMDFMGDLGGLFNALALIFGTIIAIL